MSMFSPADRIILMTLPWSSERISRMVMFFRSSNTSTSTGMSFKCPTSSKAVMRLLLDEGNGVLAHLVHSRHDVGARLVAALEDNQIGEFGGHINVRRLDRLAQHGSAPARSGQPDRREGRGPAGKIVVVAL